MSFNAFALLKREEYFFYYERVNSSLDEDRILRKFRIISGRPFSKNKYRGLMDSILIKGKVKLKKKIINQPTYKEIGLDTTNSINVDVTLSEIISYYEREYGVIELNPCDFETTIYEETTCYSYSKIMNKKKKNDVLINFRNRHVVKTLLLEKRSKIVIIYGKTHIKGIKEELQKIKQ